jgi:hypothetical protein
MKAIEKCEGGRTKAGGRRPLCRAVRGSCPLLVLFSFSFLFSAVAQDEDADALKGAPSARLLAPGAYSFQMRLPPGVDVSVRVRGKEGDDDPSKPLKGVKIQRDIGKNIVRVQQQSGETKMSDRYYVPGWCAFDDPRMGINVRRTGFDGIFEPLGTYHFPELIWAEPKTLRIEPKARDGEKKNEIYQRGDQVLEVDAITHRPIKFRDGKTEEWTYSYKESPVAIALPTSLEGPLRHAMGKLPL